MKSSLAFTNKIDNLYHCIMENLLDQCYIFEVRKYFRWSRTFIIIKQKKTLDVLDELWGGIESVP